MSESVCRWGFLGTAAIGRKIWKAVRVSGNGRVCAVASRTIERAQSYIDECSSEVPMSPVGDDRSVEAMGSYESLLARDDIDAVYIPLPTGLRKSWVIAAAKSGKHVLCEKPAAINTDDAKEMIDACKSAGVQFMDGVMFDHSARMAAIHDQLRVDSPIGKVHRIDSHFSFRGDESFRKSNIRADANLEPHGALGDLGWYCIRFTLRATNLAMPTHVRGQTLTPIRGAGADRDVPGEFIGEMRYKDGLSASFYCSFLADNRQTANVSGDAGYLSVEDFVLPFVGGESSWSENRHVLEIDNCRWNFSRHSQRKAIAEYASGEANSQEVNMVRRFGQIATTQKLDSLYPELTLKTQMILDACRRSDEAGGQLVQL